MFFFTQKATDEIQEMVFSVQRLQEDKYSMCCVDDILRKKSELENIETMASFLVTHFSPYGALLSPLTHLSHSKQTGKV